MVRSGRSRSFPRFYLCVLDDVIQRQGERPAVVMGDSQDDPVYCCYYVLRIRRWAGCLRTQSVNSEWRVGCGLWPDRRLRLQGAKEYIEIEVIPTFV